MFHNFNIGAISKHADCHKLLQVTCKEHLSVQLNDKKHSCFIIFASAHKASVFESGK